MAWQDDVRAIVRSLIYDMDTPYTYSDDKIDTLIIHAAALLINDIVFPVNYVVDISGETIDPEPTDQAFEVLLAYKTACLLARAELKVYSLRGIMVKDGPSQIDLRESSKYMSELFKNLCDKYDELKMAYLVNNSPGQAITGPIVYDWLPIIHGNM